MQAKKKDNDEDDDNYNDKNATKKFPCPKEFIKRK